MFSKMQTNKFMNNCLDNISRLKEVIANADAVLVGAGSGLSTSAGLTYSGERFEKYFSDFKNKYGIKDMYSGGFYPYQNLEMFWGWWSRHIWYNRYQADVNNTYYNLLKLVKDKDYFVITTNVDHQFQLSGFDKARLFYMQGDYGLFQCSNSCHQQTYDNKEQIQQMIKTQKNMQIPTELVPYCPKCGKPMTVNLRSDDNFVQDNGWYAAKQNYDDYISKNKDKKIVFLELGVGMNTPVWIKYPFWKMTAQNKNATYVCINLGQAVAPSEIKNRAICIDGDIAKVLNNI